MSARSQCQSHPSVPALSMSQLNLTAFKPTMQRLPLPNSDSKLIAGRKRNAGRKQQREITRVQQAGVSKQHTSRLTRTFNRIGDLKRHGAKAFASAKAAGSKLMQSDLVKQGRETASALAKSTNLLAQHGLRLAHEKASELNKHLEQHHQRIKDHTHRGETHVQNGLWHDFQKTAALEKSHDSDHVTLGTDQTEGDDNFERQQSERHSQAMQHAESAVQCHGKAQVCVVETEDLVHQLQRTSAELNAAVEELQRQSD